MLKDGSSHKKTRDIGFYEKKHDTENTQKRESPSVFDVNFPRSSSKKNK